LFPAVQRHEGRCGTLKRAPLGATLKGMRVFAAGATGSVGFAFVRLAKARGTFVRTLSHSRENAKRLDGLADEVTTQDAALGVPSLEGIDVVVSALGAAVTIAGREKRRYREVDLAGNLKLLAAAKAARVGRFVYVSVHVEPGYRDTAYVRAHEEFVDALRECGICYSVIRPTGIFPALNDFVRMARKGLATVIGDGRARTNPVDPADVAGVLLDHLTSGPAEVSVGGPEIFTRREIVELAFRVVDKRPRVMRVPPGVFRGAAKMAGWANPRLGELLEFAVKVSTTDCVAPCVGRRRLEDHFRALAGSPQSPG
jgi:uncharacterized protein YbjT (DUF2867 family)